MSRFVNPETTDTIVLRNGDQVKVRQRLTAEETALLRRDLIRFTYEAGTDGPPRVVTTGGEWYMQQINICKVYIVSWDFKDDAEQPVAYSPDLVVTLSNETVEEIAEAIDRLQEERREEFTKKGKTRSAK